MKKLSIYYFLVILMSFSLILPAMVSAEVSNGGTPEKGSLTIHKYEREPGVEDGELGDGSANQTVPGDAVLLDGVTFLITQTHELTFDSNGNEVWTAFTGNPITQITTNGKVVFDNLPLGRYEVEETDGPSNVNLNTEVYSVDIPMTNLEGTDTNYNVHIYPKNETIRGAVELTKLSGETHEILSGAKFKLYHDGGTEVEVDKLYTTNADGVIRVDGLKYGDYYFEEVAAPEGYLSQSGKFKFKIEKSGRLDEAGQYLDGVLVPVKVTNYYVPDVLKEVDNSTPNIGDKVAYSLSIKLPGDIKDYNNFIITDELDEKLTYVDGSWEVDPDVSAALDFTNNNGTLTWSVSDFAALDGKESIKIKFNALVNDEAIAGEDIENTGKIDFENKSGITGDKETEPTVITPTQGGLKVIKKADNTDGALLDGAEFDLYNSEGEKVGTGKTIDGVIVFSELKYGDYTLVETKAPGEYRLLTKPINVTIDSNEIKEIEVYNSKSGWELPKTGGIGTLLFTLVGLTFIGIALTLYLYRRRKVA